MIIDSHVHIFPDKIAEKAVAGIGKFYDLPMRHDGKLDTVFAEGRKAGIDKFVILSVATVPEQVASINNFLAENVRKHGDKLIGFCAMHPGFQGIEAELERAREMGLVGIKLHPDFQRFDIDDEKAFEIYRAAEGKMPVLFHTGDYRTGWSKPEKMAKVMDLFPNLDVIASHFGGWSEWERTPEAYKGRNVYVDTSSSLYKLTPDEVRYMVDSFGADHILFGTDFPMWNMSDELELFNKLPLTAEERELILHENMENLLKKYGKTV